MAAAAHACNARTQQTVRRTAANLRPAWAHGEFETSLDYKERLSKNRDEKNPMPQGYDKLRKKHTFSVADLPPVLWISTNTGCVL